MNAKHGRRNNRMLRCMWWAILMVGFCGQAPAAAEPSASIHFLMREPVSMMDWGLRNIEDHLYRQRNLLVQADKRLFESEPAMAAAYDWEHNRIRISITLRSSAQTQKTTQDLEAVRTHLAWIIKYLRGSLALKPYEAFFRHRGFRNQGSPPNLGQELAERTELLIRVRDLDANILSQCRGGLTDDEIVWLRIGNP